MSKNFELLQQQGEIRFGIPPTVNQKFRAPQYSDNSKNGDANGSRLQLNGKVAQEEAFKLVQNIFLLQGKESPRVVVFAGIDPRNGCSAICAQTAETLAMQQVGTVCLVDGNLRSPSLPELFSVSNHYGLTDSLSKQGSIREFAKVVGPDNLWLLSTGSLAAQSPSLLNSNSMKVRIDELRNDFDYVLIDSPSLNTYADGVALGQLADGLVLVLEANATRREVAVRVTENLRTAQIKILGAVLNKRTFPIPASLYHRL
jgi:capsular exopolysaccharide synthesis family protein